MKQSGETGVIGVPHLSMLPVPGRSRPGRSRSQTLIQNIAMAGILIPREEMIAGVRSTLRACPMFPAVRTCNIPTGAHSGMEPVGKTGAAVIAAAITSAWIIRVPTEDHGGMNICFQAEATIGRKAAQFLQPMKRSTGIGIWFRNICDSQSIPADRNPYHFNSSHPAGDYPGRIC